MLSLCIVLASARTARAEGAKQQCIRAAETAQQLRIDGRLVSARDELLVCLRASCPSVIKTHCTQWFEEVDAALPSVVLRVRDEAGSDLADATVTVDGAVVERWQTGLPMSFDPGAHTFAYERAGTQKLVTRVILGAGEKNRVLAVTLHAPGRGTPASAAGGPSARSLDASAANGSPTVRDESALAEGSSAKRTAAWVAGGVAVAAFGSLAFFGATGLSQLGELRKSCAGHCAQPDVDAAWNRLIIADVSLGVGILASAVATWLFYSSRASAPRAAFAASVRPSPFGLGLTMEAMF